MNFYWLLEDGALDHAPGAQLILYPKYPEARFSGFLKGCKSAPSSLMNSRAEGRILFLGISEVGKVFGYVTAAGTALSQSFEDLDDLRTVGVFNEVPLPGRERDSRVRLLEELRRICALEWIDSKKLIGPGCYGPCNSTNCGGMTLEAELGIMPNGRSEPDFLGWEVKQHAVTNLAKPDVGRITLMTPEPTAGFYCEHGVSEFIKRYGYQDKCGRENRFNFGGVHKVGIRHPLTGLTMTLDGFDLLSRKIVDLDGGIVLRDDEGNNAAEWKFSHIIEHWNRKHAQTVYVPSLKRKEPHQYRFGGLLRLGVGADPLKLLGAMADSSVFYDPGIKMEEASGPSPRIKRRSQFRVDIKKVNDLYSAMEKVNVLI